MYVPKASPILSTSQLERKDILLLLTIINKNDVPNLNIPQIAALIFWRSSSFPRNVRWCLEKNTPIIFSPILRCYRINLMTMACSTTNTLLNSSMHNFIWALLKLCKMNFYLSQMSRFNQYFGPCMDWPGITVISHLTLVNKQCHFC